MPQTKKQGILFGLLMSYSMTYGMEVYNTAIAHGFDGLQRMSNAVLVQAFFGTLYMGLIVFIISNLWGNAIGAHIANKITDPKVDRPYACRLARQFGTVAIMCPSMSLVATILFNHAYLSYFPGIWIGAIFKNLPIALLWNLFVATPFTHWAFQKLLRK